MKSGLKKIYGQIYGSGLQPMYGSIYGQMYGLIYGSIYGQMYGQICGPHLNMHLYLAAGCAATKTAKPSGAGTQRPWPTAGCEPLLLTSA